MRRNREYVDRAVEDLDIDPDEYYHISGDRVRSMVKITTGVRADEEQILDLINRIGAHDTWNLSQAQFETSNIGGGMGSDGRINIHYSGKL